MRRQPPYEGKDSALSGPSIALFGPYGSGNLGDVAIQEAVICNLQRMCPNVQVSGISGNPDDTRQCHAISCFPKAPILNFRATFRVPVVGKVASLAYGLGLQLRFTLKAWRWLRSIDLLMVSGGGQIDDYWGGSWGNAFDVLRWTLLAKLKWKKVAVVSVGLSQLKKPMSKLFYRTALRMADYRSFRDQGTHEYIVNVLGLRSLCHVVADLAFSLPVQSFVQNPGERSNSNVVVGVSPISHLAWTGRSDPAYLQYMVALQEFVGAMIDKGRNIRLFPSQVKMDREPVRSLRPHNNQANANRGESVIANPVQSLEDLIREINACDVVVASRLHGVLLAILMRKPVVAISYDRKVRALMQDLGCPEMCIDLDEITQSSLNDLVEEAIDRRTTLRDLADAKATAWAKALEKQYADILVLLQ